MSSSQGLSSSGSSSMSAVATATALAQSRRAMASLASRRPAARGPAIARSIGANRSCAGLLAVAMQLDHRLPDLNRFRHGRARHTAAEHRRFELDKSRGQRSVKAGRFQRRRV
jgi:hypothetical protein